LVRERTTIAAKERKGRKEKEELQKGAKGTKGEEPRIMDPPSPSDTSELAERPTAWQAMVKIFVSIRGGICRWLFSIFEINDQSK
jgi:hypothetical protein